MPRDQNKMNTLSSCRPAVPALRVLADKGVPVVQGLNLAFQTDWSADPPQFLSCDLEHTISSLRPSEHPLYGTAHTARQVSCEDCRRVGMQGSPQKDALGSARHLPPQADAVWAPGSGAIGPGALSASQGSITCQAKQCYHFLPPHRAGQQAGHRQRNLPVYFKKAQGLFPPPFLPPSSCLFELETS